MKRLLSLILALALVIGMIPAVFATENLVEKYMFNTSTGVETFKVGSKVSIPGASSVWEVIAMPGLYSSTAITASETTFSVNTLTPNNNNALVLSLSVNKAGVYEPTFSFNLNQIYTGRIDFYLADKDFVLEKGWDLSTPEFLATMISSVKEGNVQYIASQDINKNSTDEDNNWTVPVVLDEGENYLFAIINTPTCGVDHTSRTFCVIKSLTLTCKGAVTASVGATALRVGGSTTISAVVTDGTGTVVPDAEVTYTSSDNKILTVDGEGNISATGEGTATITATATLGDVEVCDSVTITSELVEGKITVTADKTSLKKGETTTITATAKDADGNDCNAIISYESTDENVATVDANGTVTAVGEGTATITAKATIDGIDVESNGIDITVSVVWSPKYVFSKAAFSTQPTDGNGVNSWLVQYATEPSLLNPKVSTGEWKYVAGHALSLASSLFDTDRLYIYSGSYLSSGKNALILEIDVDVSGYYKPEFDYYKYNGGGVLNYWITSKDEFDNKKDGDKNYDITNYSYAINATLDKWQNNEATVAGIVGTKLGSKDTYYSEASGYTVTDSYESDKAIYIAAGKYYLYIQATAGTATDAKRVVPMSLTLTRQPTMETTVSKTTLAVGDSATLTSGVTSGENQDITATTEVTYTSSDRNVVQVSGNTITAVGEGTATITATAANGATDTVEITVEKYVSAPKTLSLYVTAENGDISATVDGSPANVVTSVAQGAKVTVTANDTATHRFSCWMGTAGVASFDAEYTFNIYTNTALEAVYEAKPEENQVVVSFYKPNRELFATKVVDKDTTFGSIGLDTKDISLVGYNTFKGWAIGESENEEPVMIDDDYVITEDLGIVAVFEEKTPVTGISVNNVAQENISYGQPIVLDNSSAAKFRYWTKNGVVISYIKKFTHYAWQNDAEIKSVVEYSEPAKPVAVLEKYGTTDSWMFEYEIPENCTRLEVGIIFGNSDDITIDSCFARAVSRRGAEEKHGQFTASSDYTHAKGYIIFKDNKDKTCVVYSK